MKLPLSSFRIRSKLSHLKVLRWVSLFPRRVVTKAIWFYQKTFSPDHSAWGKALFPGGYCKFHPSCSEYANQALNQHGLFLGSLKAASRILRCNPWSQGGQDSP